MSDKQSIPDTTRGAAIAISKKHGIPTQVVRSILDDYVECIYEALEREVPFTISSLCKFYHNYTKPNGRLVDNNARAMPDGSSYYKDKVNKSVKCKLVANAASRLNGCVHDLGIASNRASELLKIHIKPDEIEKIRRRKTLEEQRSLGFRSDLLFDETPLADTVVEAKLGPAPTIQDIADRIGINLGD